MIQKLDCSDKATQQQVGIDLLVADENWRSAGCFLRLKALILGRLQLVEHLGKFFVVKWLQEKPFLIFVEETSNMRGAIQPVPSAPTSPPPPRLRR